MAWPREVADRPNSSRAPTTGVAASRFVAAKLNSGSGSPRHGQSAGAAAPPCRCARSQAEPWSAANRAVKPDPLASIAITRPPLFVTVDASQHGPQRLRLTHLAGDRGDPP